MIPSSRALLSRDKRLPRNTWNQSRLKENVFGNQICTFGSPLINLKKFQSDHLQGNREAVPGAERTKTSHTSEDRQNQDTISMPTFAPRPLTTTSTIPVELPQNYMVGQQRANIGISIRQIPFSTIVLGAEKSIQNTSHDLLWFSIGCYVMDQRSGDGWFFGRVKNPRDQFLEKVFPNFEMLDAKIVSEQDHPEFQFKKKSSLEEQTVQKEDRLLRGRQIVFMIYDYFRVRSPQDTVLDYADLVSVTLLNNNIQEFDTRWDEVLSSMFNIPSRDIMESLYKLRIRESDH